MKHARFETTVDNALTREPMDVVGEVAQASIVLRVGDRVCIASQRWLTKDEALMLADQIVKAVG